MSTRKALDAIIYWSLVLIPFSMGISPVPVSVFSGLAIVAFLIKAVIARTPVDLRSPVSRPLLLVFLFSGLSFVHSLDYGDSVKGGLLRLLLYSCVMYVMAQGIRDATHLRRISSAACAGLLLVSIDALWQLKTGHSFIRRGFAPILNIGLLRATSSFKDANTFGVYLSALTPLLCALAMYAPQPRHRRWYFLASLISLVGVALTYSRPTLLAVYLALWLLALARRHKLVIILLVAGTLLAPFVAPRPVKEFARQVEYNPLRFMCNEDRIAIYLNSLRMIKAHPFIGVGVNTYMKNYRFYKYPPQYRNAGTSDYIYAHSNFLHLAAEIGLLGLAAFVWLLYRLFRHAWQLYHCLSDEYLKVVCLGLAACLLAFQVNGLTESSLYSARVALIFWYLSGALLGLEKFCHGRKA